MNETYLTVGALTDYLQYKFTADPYLQEVTVEGEVTNFKIGTKHKYFKLKDENEEKQISITMFSWQFNQVNFPVENGMKVRITGKIELYAPNGTYSLVAKKMVLAGEGELHQKFLEIQQKLQQEGVFQFQKKAIPLYPKKIAVVTSPTGAVIHDIIRVVNERYPLAEIVLFPAVVQGQLAPSSLVQQLEMIQRNAEEYDVAIVGRGGGSYEELFCFNDEAVVRAASHLTIPLITCVGHQVDLTLIDEVADYSASTPTAAATKATPDRTELTQKLKYFRQLLQTNVEKVWLNKEQQLRRCAQSPVFKQSEQLYQMKEIQLEQLKVKLEQAIQQQYQQKWIAYQNVKARLNDRVLEQQFTHNQTIFQHQKVQLLKAFEQDYTKKKEKLSFLKQQLSALNPEAILKRGYAYVTKEKEWIESGKKLQVNDEIVIHLQDATLLATITKKEMRKEE